MDKIRVMTCGELKQVSYINYKNENNIGENLDSKDKLNCEKSKMPEQSIIISKNTRKNKKEIQKKSNFKDREKSIVKIRPGSEIVQINSIESLALVTGKYLSKTSDDKNKYSIDFNKISKEYDGVHISQSVINLLKEGNSMKEYMNEIGINIDNITNNFSDDSVIIFNKDVLAKDTNKVVPYREKESKIKINHIEEENKNDNYIDDIETILEENRNNNYGNSEEVISEENNNGNFNTNNSNENNNGNSQVYSNTFIEPIDVYKDIDEYSQLIENTSKTLHSNNGIFEETEVYKYREMIEDIEGLKGMQQNEKFHPEGDAYAHTELVVDEARRLCSLSSNPELFVVGAMLHDIGKVNTIWNEKKQRYTAFGHEKTGLPIAEKILDKYNYSYEDKQYVLNLIENHMVMYSLEKAKNDVPWKKFFSNPNWKDIALLSVCDEMGAGFSREICLEKGMHTMKMLEKKRKELNII